MTEKKRRIETGAIQDIVSQIHTEAEAKTIAHLALSEFGDRYNPEFPEQVKKIVNKTARILKELHKKGYDMNHYCNQMMLTAVRTYNDYTGEKENIVWESTLRAIDGALYQAAVKQKKIKVL